MRNTIRSQIGHFLRHCSPALFFGRLLGRAVSDAEMAIPHEEFCKTVFSHGQTALVFYLAFLNVFVPLSMDLYLPALPHMAEVFQCSRSLSELTVSMFILFFGLSMLVWGTFSDRYGRKHILHCGLGLYFCASAVCIAAPGIKTLIFGRVLQAVGSGAIASVSMAIVKDIFKGRVMENVLIWIQTMTVLGPMVAPVVGAFLLQFLSWRGLFVILLLCSVGAGALSFSLKETLGAFGTASGMRSLSRIFVVLRNNEFRRLLLLFSAAAMPFMAYLTSSSFIYIRFFGLSEQTFSFFFAANAICAAIGPLLYLRFFREMKRRHFITLSFCVMGFSGAMLHLFGSNGPFYFLFMYMPLTIFGTALRPVATVLMMSQQDTDNGTVASLIGSVGLLFGSLSMILCSLGWSNPIRPVASIALLIGSVCASTWLYLDGRGLYRSNSRFF